MSTDDEITSLLERFAEGWSRVEYDGHPYGLTKTAHGNGRSLSIFAEQLGGADIVSANVYRTGGAAVLKPCEMPAAKVLDFLRRTRVVT